MADDEFEFEELLQHSSTRSEESSIINHFKDQYFSRISSGPAREHFASVFSASFNLANTILGAGILTIPFNFNRTGYAAGILL